MADTIQDWDPQRLRQFILSTIQTTGPSADTAATPVVVPVGTILLSGGRPTNNVGAVVDPPGFLVCDGRIKKKAEYPRLARRIAGLWDNGATPAADEFIIPDLRRAFILGQDFDRPDGGVGGTAQAGNISNVVVNPAAGTTFPLAILTFIIKH